MKFMEAIGTRIDNLLKEKKMSKYRLCKKIRLARGTLDRIINAQNKDVRNDTLARIAFGLGITMAEFFNDNMFDFENLDD